jgi:hypothetical protein
MPRKPEGMPNALPGTIKERQTNVCHLQAAGRNKRVLKSEPKSGTKVCPRKSLAGRIGKLNVAVNQYYFMFLRIAENIFSVYRAVYGKARLQGMKSHVGRTETVKLVPKYFFNALYALSIKAGNIVRGLFANAPNT